MKNLKTIDKIKTIFDEEIGKHPDGTESGEEALHGVPREKITELKRRIILCELDAVEEYSKQFVDFINNCDASSRTTTEWCYIICGMWLAVRSLLKLPINPEAKGKIKELNNVVKEFVGTNVGYIGVAEDKDE